MYCLAGHVPKSVKDNFYTKFCRLIPRYLWQRRKNVLKLLFVTGRRVLMKNLRALWNRGKL